VRIVILTSSELGFASLCLPVLADDSKIQIVLIVQNEGKVLKPLKTRKRQLKKTMKIGILGALNGVRIRSWFREDVNRIMNVKRLDKVARCLGIRLERTPSINIQRTMDLFKEMDADLGLSLGNGYIGSKVFSIPRLGMINVHHEILPQFRGAASTIWQIYEGSMETGYAIHQIDRKIDTGNILYQERMPIELKPTLRQTVTHNYARALKSSSESLLEVVNHFPELAANSKPQGIGRSFTTPTFWQFLRMVRQHRRLVQENRGSGAGIL